MYSVLTSDYEVGFVLGKSCFSSSVVYAGKYKNTGEVVAIKKYDVDSMSLKEIDVICKESYLMHQLKHANVVTALTAFVEKSEIVIILPLLEYKSCTDLITKHFHTGLPEIVIKVILRHILAALEFLHEKGIIHRAVKASHILIGIDGHAKLSGLQYSFQREWSSNSWPKSYDFPANCVANQNWLSPEVLQQDRKGYDEKSDIYSLGITVCELANGFVPYSNIKLSKMLMQKVGGNIPFIYDETTVCKIQVRSDKEFVNIFSNYFSIKRFSRNLHKFKDLCLIFNAHERPSAKVLLQHNLITKTDKTKMPFQEIILPALPITTKSFTTNEKPEDQRCDGDKEKNQQNDTAHFVSWDF